MYYELQGLNGLHRNFRFAKEINLSSSDNLEVGRDSLEVYSK